MSQDTFSYTTKMPPPDYHNNTCQLCRYFHSRSHDPANKPCTYGECHRYPPTNFVINGNVKTILPMVTIDTFACGEFARKYEEIAS